jgi:hypothetical protein
VRANLQQQFDTLRWLDSHIRVVLTSLKGRSVMPAAEVDWLLQGLAGIGTTLDFLARDEVATKTALASMHGHAQR